MIVTSDFDGVCTAPSKWLKLLKFIGRNTLKRINPNLYYWFILPFNHRCKPNREMVEFLLFINKSIGVSIVTAREPRDEEATREWWKKHFPKYPMPDLYCMGKWKINFLIQCNPALHFDNREDIKETLSRVHIPCILIGG